MSSDDIAISVRNLTKTYRLFAHPGDRIKQAATLGLRKFHKEFTALKDVSFDIKKGETVGIIGRNGSGKSTLLQVICGILKPTSGTVQVNGRVSALLELGAGFNPEFTGRENVYFQGALMGFNKARIDERFDDIAAFADIGEFIDQPVRTYSSGMFVRLAFASATHRIPNVLVVDEALSVGDAHFQSKCFARMNEIQSSGGTVLFVSHTPEQIAHHCNRALWLERGRMAGQGEAMSMLQAYLSSWHLNAAARNIDADGDLDCVVDPCFDARERRWGNGDAIIENVRLLQKGTLNPSSILSGEHLEISFTTRFRRAVSRPIYGLTIKNLQGTPMFSANSRQLANAAAGDAQAGEHIQARFFIYPYLDAGEYLLSFGIVEQTPGNGIIVLDRRYDALRMRVAHPASEDFVTDMRARCELAAVL